MKYLRIWVCLSLLFAPAVVSAQPASTSDSADLVRALLNRVEQLEKRVAELEGRSGTPAPAAQPAVAAAEPATTAPETAAGPPNPNGAGAPGHMSHRRTSETNVDSHHHA